MYIPKHFSNEDMALAHRLIAENAFGLLISPAGDLITAPELSHIPMLHVKDDTENGHLIGHVAKANPHWKSFDGQRPAIAIFSGPHAYISPNWYANKVLVPTWNYAAVHVHGTPEVVSEGNAAEEILRKLVSAFEHDGTGNWSMDQLPDGNIESQLKGIVAFRIPVSGYEIKVKMSQNRGVNDIAGVIAALGQSDRENDQATAKLMQKLNTSAAD